MKGKSSWSYAPYRPVINEVGDIYICRVVPYENKIHFEWLPLEEGARYSVFYKKRGNGEFIHLVDTEDLFSDIDRLDTETDYEFYITSGDKSSRVRLAHTGRSVGTVVNYLHPDDEAYAFSGRYLCSPSIVRHPDGFLLASMDLFAGNHPQNLTLIFRSDDDGESWHYVSELMPCFWGKMFIHKGELYMLSCSTEYGDLLIGKSTDGGKSFSTPVCLLRGSNGKNGNCGVHKNPQNVFAYKGRLYNTLEWGSWDNLDYYHAAMVMSCDMNDDLLVPENWSFSEPLKYDPSWKGAVDGKAFATVEGTLCVAPNGKLYNIMRYNIDASAKPPYGRILAYKVNTSDFDAPLEYSHAINMPGNNSKFTIKFDPLSKKYYSIVTRIYTPEYVKGRNLLSLMCSDDLDDWRLVCDIFDHRHESVEKVGFQYVDFEFEGDDLIFLCRTAINDAKNYHDANYSVFDRIKDFRSLVSAE